MTAALKLNQKGTERIGNGDYIHTYKIEIHGWIFASAGVIPMAVALLTVSYQSIKRRLQTLQRA